MPYAVITHVMFSPTELAPWTIVLLCALTFVVLAFIVLLIVHLRRRAADRAEDAPVLRPTVSAINGDDADWRWSGNGSIMWRKNNTSMRDQRRDSTVENAGVHNPGYNTKVWLCLYCFVLGHSQNHSITFWRGNMKHLLTTLPYCII